MIKKREYAVSCHFDDNGFSLQKIVEKYFVIYFREKLEKLEDLNES